jgi:hypothetical protein
MNVSGNFPLSVGRKEVPAAMKAAQPEIGIRMMSGAAVESK